MQRNFAAILTVGGHQLVASAILHDHVHILIRQHPRTVLNSLVAKLKRESEGWLHGMDLEHGSVFKWQKGYAAFTVSRSRTGLVRRYLAHQESLHMRVNVKQELDSLLEPKWDEQALEPGQSASRMSIVADPSDASGLR